MNRRFPCPAFLGLLAAVALFGLAYPLYALWPFRGQTPGELHLALLVLRYRSVVEFLVAVAALATLFIWRHQHNRRSGAWVISATLLVCACGLLTRVNVFEVLFHPVSGPSFAPVAQSHLDGKEKVLAVKIGTSARAYPVRNLSYHHIVNDVLGGVPIAATY